MIVMMERPSVMEGMSKYDIFSRSCQGSDGRQRYLVSRPGTCLVVTWAFSHIRLRLSRGFRASFLRIGKELLQTITLRYHVLIAIVDVAAWLE